MNKNKKMQKNTNDQTFFKVTNSDIYAKLVRIEHQNDLVSDKLRLLEERHNGLQKVVWGGLGALGSAFLALATWVINIGK